MVKIEGKPRLCKIVIWPDFDGYGFNLHAEKSRPGQYVGKVDEGSPAEAAGLREGDRIIEVNGYNISTENHKQVVSRIKSILNETSLLVVDSETERIYKESGLVISNEDAIEISAQRDEIEIEDEDRKSLESNTSSLDKVKKHTLFELKPRLCRVIRSSKEEKFGFSLLTDKSTDTQHIGNVYPGTPAYRAGVKPHDRIIEVNGVNVENIEHKDIVAKVNKSKRKLELLLVDNRTHVHYKKEEIKVHGAMKELLICTEKTLEDDSALFYTHGGKIRSCHIIKNEPSESFGFSIQTVKKENTKFIKEITPDGPADRSGLLLDDVVLAVNGEDVVEETHKDVVDRIISRDLDTTLLVTDRDTFNHCMEQNIPLVPHPLRVNQSKGTSNMRDEEGRVSSVTSTTIEATIEPPKIIVCEPVDTLGDVSSEEVSVDANETTTITPPPAYEEDLDYVQIVHVNPSASPSPVEEIVEGTKEMYLNEDIGEEKQETQRMGSTGNSPSPRSTPSPQLSNHSPEITQDISRENEDSEYDDLNLNMTAAEMREIISSKKKRDPRKDDRMDIRRKFEIVQTL
nr:Na(+)/H(+) exchange regulatory cofactor NHE-RF3-like isoform X3 [Lepeophtheirus salmonis]